MFTILKGTFLLCMVLALFTWFTYRAPKGSKAMGALAGAACVSFLVYSFHYYVSGDLLNIEFLRIVGDSAGNIGGIVAVALVLLAMGVSPVYSLMMAAACSDLGLVPGFIAGYIISFFAVKVEEKVPTGLDLLVMLVVLTPLTRLIGVCVAPLIDATLFQISEVINTATNANPLVMGIILGGIITVVSTSPLSSMALTTMMGLTGLPMAIAALGTFAIGFTNFIIFRKFKLGNKGTPYAVALEPLTQAHIIAANPLPIYIPSFVGGALTGIVVSLLGLINDAPGTTSPAVSPFIMFTFNEPSKMWIGIIASIVIGTVVGLAAVNVFKDKQLVEPKTEVQQAA
ncbi:MAG: PTS sugar transporter subunit IIC [Bacillaceae bacterium]